MAGASRGAHPAVRFSERRCRLGQLRAECAVVHLLALHLHLNLLQQTVRESGARESAMHTRTGRDHTCRRVHHGGI